MGHFIDTDGSIYVDSDFANRVQRLSYVELNHMGFGEFEVITPEGKVEIDRMRGKPFEGMSGRSHKFYDDKGGTHIAMKIIKDMEHHNFSEPGGAAKTATRIVDRFKASFDAEAGVQTRPIHEIANEIRQDWKPVNYAAKPYLEAMESLDKITDSYGQDDARMIVTYFLSNAQGWKGEKAKAIKVELKKMLK